MTRYRLWLIGLGFAAWLGWPGAASACGTVQDWVARYGDPKASEAGRTGALIELASYCGDYFGAESDRALVPVLSDALARGHDGALVQRVFDRFRCLSATRGEMAREALAARLDTKGCPGASALARWRRVAADGVNLRSGPSRSATRLATLPRNAVVEAMGNDGAWLRVRTFAGVDGFIHGTLLTAGVSD